MRIRPVLLALAAPLALHAQQPERISLDGQEVAVYNLVGRLKVEGGTGDKVVIEVTRGGRDAAKLKLLTGSVRGRNALRIDYPEDRIYYSDARWNGRSSFTINDDGTWGENNNDRGSRYDRRRIEVSSRGDGLDAHADLHVIVPKGKTLYLRQGIGETTVDNVDGNLNIDVAASRARVSHVRGNVSVDAGSGGIDVDNITGDLILDSGSGGATVESVTGSKLQMDIGSGSLRGRGLDVKELVADVGSGGVRLSNVKTQRLHVEAGSGGSDIELMSAPADVSIESGSGGATLRMPSTTSAAIEIETGSGGIDTDFDVKLNRMERRSLRGTIGTGTGRIRIETGSGTVRLLKN